MKIGFIRQEMMKIKKQDGTTEDVKWLECYIRMAGVRPFNIKMAKNKNQDTTKKQPDYNLYMRSNVNKNDTFRDIPVGALWMGSAMIDGEQKTFMTGYIESPLFGRLNIAVWKAQPLYEGEQMGFLYEIKTMEDKKAQDQEDSYQAPTYDMPQQAPIQNGFIPEIEIDNDEIPF